MILTCCAVFDNAIQAFAQPFFVAARGAALRSFQDEVNRSDGQPNPLNQHPEDFDLYVLSEYDDHTGLFIHNTPELLARGKEVTTS